MATTDALISEALQILQEMGEAQERLEALYGPETYVGSVLGMADDNGCITYDDAWSICDSHGLLEGFLDTYGTVCGWANGIDAGEFLTWLGY